MQIAQLHQNLNSRKKKLSIYYKLELPNQKKQKKYVIVQKIEFMLIRYTSVV